MIDEELTQKETKEGKILFTTTKNDPKHWHLRGNPLAIESTNIPSYMGGRANLWQDS